MIEKPLQVLPNINARSAFGVASITILNVDATESQLEVEEEEEEEEEVVPAPVMYRKKINLKGVRKFLTRGEDNVNL